MTKEPSPENENFGADHRGDGSLPRFGEQDQGSKPWGEGSNSQPDGQSSGYGQQYGGEYGQQQPRYGQNDPQGTYGQNESHGAYGQNDPQGSGYQGQSYGSGSSSAGYYGNQGDGQYQRPGSEGYGNGSNGYGEQAPYGGAPSQYGSQPGQQPQYQPQGYGQPQYQQYPTSQAERPNGWGMGLAALICGIGSLVLCWLVFPGLAGIVAIILGIVAIKKLGKTPGAGKAMPIIGIIVGAIGVIVSVVFLIFYAFSFSIANEAAKECGGFSNATSSSYDQCIDDYVNSHYGN